MQYSKELASLIEFFQKFPGVGPKSAQRMAFHLLKMSGDEVQKFANVMVEAKENIKYLNDYIFLTFDDRFNYLLDDLGINYMNLNNEYIII